MADKAPINRVREYMERDEINRSADSAPGFKVRSILADLLELMELQASILKQDLLGAAKNIVRPMILLSVAIACLFGAIPVGLLLVAKLLTTFGGLSEVTGLAVAFALGLVGAGVIAGWGIRKLKQFSQPLERSKDEFKKNLQVVRSLVHPGRQ